MKIADEAYDSMGWHWIQNETGEWKVMSDKPTGEWTAQRIVKFLGLHSKHAEACSFLADAINAALAAERERMSILTMKRANQLEQQLAAVDDFFRDQNGHFMVEGDTTFRRVQNYTQELDGRIDDLEQQLAVERHKHAKTAKQFVDMKAYADATEQQLVAEREKVAKLERKLNAKLP